MNPEIRLKGAPNFRDLGGYTSADGRRVRRGKMFRSEGLHQLKTDDYVALHDLGIRLICDLRSDVEREKKPTVWPAHMLPTTLVMDVNADLRANNSDLMDMLRDDPTAQGVQKLFAHVYRFVPEALTKHLAKFFDAITEDGHLPLILHCSAGKDRTGVLSAILLMALGVPRETVVHDYMKTNEYRDAAQLKAKVFEIMEPILGAPPSDEMVDMMAGVEEHYIETSLESIESSYGKMSDYLLAAGVSELQLAKFRALMLE
jgi:protein-tyrosine phosphatase